MKVLVACEFSGIVREAFRAMGHDAWSCDILPTEIPGQHIQADVLTILNDDWDLMIAHPPCTYLANSGSKHLYLGMKKVNGINPDRWMNMKEGAAFLVQLLNAPIPRICVENPVVHGHALALIGSRPSQIIQPWQFGHGEIKKTCLWLRNLPLLIPADVVPGRKDRVHKEPPSAERWKNRSRTYSGIARAMAEQWSQP